MLIISADDTSKYISLRPDHLSNGSTVPGWEGVVNPKPEYMDMAFYVINRERRNQIRSLYKQMSHMSPADYLQMTTKFNPAIDLIVEYGGSTHEYGRDYPDLIYYVTKSYIGFVHGVAKDAYGKFRKARISWEVAERNEMIYGGYPSQTGPADFTKDMDDENFLLSKYAKILEPEEVIK